MNKKQDVAFLNFNVTAGPYSLPILGILFGMLIFFLFADLTPLFNWNTKQLFLYVQAEYTNAQGVKNEVVIWDKIVRSKEEANLALEGRNKYLFRNLGTTFRYGPRCYCTRSTSVETSCRHHFASWAEHDMF